MNLNEWWVPVQKGSQSRRSQNKRQTVIFYGRPLCMTAHFDPWNEMNHTVTVIPSNETVAM